MPELEPGPRTPLVLSPSDQRRTPRHDPTLLFRCLVLPDAQAPLGAGILDISLAGVGLVLAAGLEPGQPIMLRFPRSGDLPPLDVPAEVIYCQEQSRGDAFAGCRFDARLTEADLRAVLP
jgi:hypothetical protein